MSTLQGILQGTRTCPASVPGVHSTDCLAYSLEHSRAYSLKVREVQVRAEALVLTIRLEDVRIEQNFCPLSSCFYLSLCLEGKDGGYLEL